jgi:hypothetical protein
MVSSVDNSDQSRGFVQIVSPAMHYAVYYQPVTGSQTDLAIFQDKDGLAGDLHQAVNGGCRVHTRCAGE